MESLELQNKYDKYVKSTQMMIKHSEKGGTQVFKIRVNYNSGIQEEFWVTEFEGDGTKYTWMSLFDNQKPMKMEIDNVESIWQVGFDTIDLYDGKEE